MRATFTRLPRTDYRRWTCANMMIYLSNRGDWRFDLTGAVVDDQILLWEAMKNKDDRVRIQIG